MSNALPGSSPADRAAPSKPVLTPALILRNGGAALIFVTLLIGAHVLQTTPGYGASAALSLLIGAALGVAFERVGSASSASSATSSSIAMPDRSTRS